MSDAYSYCVRLLSQKNYSSSQLIKKLKERNLTSDEIAETLEKLKRHSYLDDSSAKRSFVHKYLKKGLAILGILYKSRQLHLDLNRDEIENIIQDSGINTSENLAQLIQRKLPHELPENLDDRLRLMQKVFRHFVNKGHSADTILQLLKVKLNC